MTEGVVRKPECDKSKAVTGAAVHSEAHGAHDSVQNPLLVGRALHLLFQDGPRLDFTLACRFCGTFAMLHCGASPSLEAP